MAKFLEKTWSSDSMEVVFTLGNGKSLSIDLTKVTKDILLDLAKHGASQKIGDSAAGFSKAQDFSGALEAMESVKNNLLAGLWKAEGSGGSGSAILAEALAEVTGRKLEDVKKALEAADEEKLKTWRANAKVKAVMARISAERAAARAAAAEDEEIEL